MILLLEQFWLWLIFGIALIVWGAAVINLSLSAWVSILINWLFSGFSEDTKQEKRSAKQTQDEEVIVANPGCFLLLAGCILLGFGLLRWLS